MIYSSISSIVVSLSGRQLGEDVGFTGVSIDTRTLIAGNLYFAISGENFDGHRFCAQAVEIGAVAIVVEHEQDLAVPQLVVKDCRGALRDLAVYWRNQFDIPVVAITGSSGKTTVKEMVYSIFSQVGPTLATSGNLNNELGVPLTLLRLSKEDQRAVIEIGANHVGEIAQIVEYVRPTVAAITMIGPSHLEGFGSIEAIAVAKSELYSGLQEGGTAIINRDDDFYSVMRDAANGSTVLTFGVHGESDVCTKVSNGNTLLVTPIGKSILKLALLGAHNRQNALVATAVAAACNINIVDIASGLEFLTAMPGRLQVRSDIKEYQVIDDTYNANPASVMAAIDVLDELCGNNCLVLGDMAELGPDSEKMHESIGRYAAKVDKQLLCIGSYSQYIAHGFGSKSVVNENMDALFSAFLDKVKRGSNVLVKGSRSAGMEQFIERISEREKTAACQGDAVQ